MAVERYVLICKGSESGTILSNRRRKILYCGIIILIIGICGCILLQHTLNRAHQVIVYKFSALFEVSDPSNPCQCFLNFTSPSHQTLTGQNELWSHTCATQEMARYMCDSSHLWSGDAIFSCLRNLVQPKIFMRNQNFSCNFGTNQTPSDQNNSWLMVKFLESWYVIVIEWNFLILFENKREKNFRDNFLRIINNICLQLQGSILLLYFIIKHVTIRK